MVTSQPPDWSRLQTTMIMTVVAFLAIAAIAAAYFGFEDVYDRVTQISMEVLLLCFGLAFLNYAIRGLRWHLFTVRIGTKISLRTNLLYFFAGFAMGTTPGKVGEAFRLWLLQKHDGTPYYTGAAIFLADRLSDLTGVLVLSMIGAAALTGYWFGISAALVILVLVTLLFLYPSLLREAIGYMYMKFGRGERFFAGLRLATRRVGRILDVRTYVQGNTLSLLGWFVEALVLHYLLIELGTELPLMPVVFVFCFSLFAGAIAMLPGGLGGTESSMFGLLLTLGVDSDIALAATIVTRVCTLWFAVFLGFIALPISLWYVHRVRRSDDVSGYGDPGKTQQEVS